MSKELVREVRHNNEYGRTRVTVGFFFAALAIRRLAEALNN